ncbi:hypothetical protein MLD38_033775 [Melastoma candidum]|uniref:Uncharacterized protein n=1 Tax=Melastoma candidum TaxID=119954 RepID=A0ACB9M7L8_9MYRT|nr:hypothetical protein MLD38_033775 [Melastoma candidum]
MADPAEICDDLFARQIAKILDDSRTSSATHNRKLRELSSLRSNPGFFPSFSRALTPLFEFQRRSPSCERAVKFVASFAAASCGEGWFLEEFLRFLLVAAAAANKATRFRACQIVSEIILRLPDEAEVDGDLWDEVIDSMMIRLRDKVPVVRVFAVRALSRFVNDEENSEILNLFLELLPLEQNVEVRKALVLSLPPSTMTCQVIVDCTLDVNESVRRATYSVLANKFPLQSLSIKLRTLILQRGLHDRSVAVAKECLKLLKDEWLGKCCQGDTVELLKYLDVETYEAVGVSVMEALSKAGTVKLHEVERIRQFLSSSSTYTEVGIQNSCNGEIQLMEAESALCWRVMCSQLQAEAQEKGSDVAAMMGSEAAVHAAEALNCNDLLENILPATVSDYISLVKAHIDAGTNYHFVTRQLLLVGTMLDFSDATNRKTAATFLRTLLQRLPECEVDDNGNVVALVDSINPGGDEEWANAVITLARKVHSASGEFEDAVLQVIEELARPCRERAADLMQWIRCLAVTGLLLENTESYYLLQGKAIEPEDVLRSLLLPGAKHVNPDVQKVAVRCLGLFGLLERTPSGDLVRQLRQSCVKGPSLISREASLALLDLMMWHGPEKIDQAVGISNSESLDTVTDFHSLKLSDIEDSNIGVLNLLYASLYGEDRTEAGTDEEESVISVLGEGFAKILLLSDKYPSLSTSSQVTLLVRLISLFFGDETKDLQRLRQCLSVFFEHYPCLSSKHKDLLSKAFVPVMRSMWPGIDNNPGGSTYMVSNLRKRAVQASRFMLQMMETPLYPKESKKEEASLESSESIDSPSQTSPETGDGGLAIRIATEVASFTGKRTPAERSYAAALCRILVLLKPNKSEQEAIKLLRRLMNNVVMVVASERDLLKELRRFSEFLGALDRSSDQELSRDRIEAIFGRLGLKFDLDLEGSCAVPETPVPCLTRTTRTRRRARQEESSSSDDDLSPQSVASYVPPSTTVRSQRASKTAALTKITTTNRKVPIDEDDDGEEEDDSDSNLTSDGYDN